MNANIYQAIGRQSRYRLTMDGSVARPVLVGEDNPGSTNPSWALAAGRPGSAGWRLCYKVLGLTEPEYYRRFRRVNLCLNSWSKREAKATALALLVVAREEPIVLLGAKVCKIFMLPYEPFRRYDAMISLPDLKAELIVLPHPSGRCRFWHDPTSYDKARELLKEYLA